MIISLFRWRCILKRNTNSKNNNYKINTIKIVPFKLILKVFYFILFFGFQIKVMASHENRVLLVIAELDARGIPAYQKIYKGIEDIAFLIPATFVNYGNTYREIHVLNNNNATAENFRNKLNELVEDKNTSTIDVIMSLHGRKQGLSFVDGSYSLEELRKILIYDNQINQTLYKNKLRLIYNLSCYGHYHSNLFLEMGFKTAIGSLAVNANGELEYPSFISRWSRGLSVQSSLAFAMQQAVLKLIDLPIKLLGLSQNNFLKNVNSKKIISGDSKIKIESNNIINY